MANPNIVAVSSIYANTVMDADVAASAVSLLTCGSNKVQKINSLVIANIDGTNAAAVSVEFYNGSTAYRLASTISVPADSTLVVMGKDSPIYLEEGCSIRGGASAGSDLEIVISYDELDDA